MRERFTAGTEEALQESGPQIPISVRHDIRGADRKAS
jgi:hypothetical protein